ncbi:MAG: DUF1501 domain-containing protein [Gemmataceae bacterium]
MTTKSATWRHPRFTRRDLLQAGSIGLLGLSLPEVLAARAQASSPARDVKSVIYLFLSGGLAQHESFDPKPEAPDVIRGEFAPIRTKTPGLQICEYLPRLAARSDKWAVLRSLTHSTNDHSLGHHVMLTGRSDRPVGFDPASPRPSDFPTFASLAGKLLPGRGPLPSSAVIPYHLVHDSGRVIPGQYAGEMGRRNDPWVVHAAKYCSRYGACPDCFDHQQRPTMRHVGDPTMQQPNLGLPQDMNIARLTSRRGLLQAIDPQRREIERQASQSSLDRHRERAWSLLGSSAVRDAFDLSRESPQMLDAYGQNLFGWSCLLARRLVESEVRMVQVNLGRNETWDTHGNAFPHLKNNLLPPMDQCVSTLLDDLEARGLLETTLVVMAGEFGRTPRISHLPQHYALPGRDHWGAVQSVFLAGGGIPGGTVLGSSDKNGGYPATFAQTPENLSATIFTALGVSRDTMWLDPQERPHAVHRAEPIPGLL